jgi:hypothetical protein
MRAIVISLFILLWSVPSFAACTKDEVCKLMGKMGHFEILDKCPNAGALLIECKNSSTKPIEELGEPKFVDNNDGTISDTNNKLIWLKSGIYKKMSLKKAKAFAATAKEAGVTGWRVPTLPELKTLLQNEKKARSDGKKAWIDPLFMDDGDYYYWTTTTCEDVSFIVDRYQKKTCQQGDQGAWLVHFKIGAIIWHFVKTENFFVWLVKESS